MRLIKKIEQLLALATKVEQGAPGNATTYTWDSLNRLESISGPGTDATFTYDALGRRVTKTVNGQRKVPEKAEHISKDALTYWLRRERQDKMDQRGWAE